MRQTHIGRCALILWAIAVCALPAGGAPIQLWCPWTAGDSWTAGAPGSFYGQGYHTGVSYWAVDFNKASGSDCGQPIRAAADGWIREAGWTDSYGWHVHMQHSENGNYWTMYGHFASDPKSDPGIQVGQFVRHGDVIGKCGTTGWSTGCHLHFMLYDGAGNSVQPSPMSGQSINTNENGKVLVSDNNPCTPPGAPGHVSPDPSASYSTNSAPTLRASKGSGTDPTGYQFYIRKSGGGEWYSGQWVGLIPGTTDSQWQTPALASGDYYWKAQATNPCAPEGGGPWCAERHLHINYPPNTPSLASPADGAVLASRSVPLSWNGAADPDGGPGAVRYCVNRNNWGGETGWIGTATSTSLTAPSDGTFAWQVKAADDWNESGYSGTRSFIVDTAAPSLSLTGPSPSTWLRTPQQVTWTATDATSGVATKTLTWDSGGSTTTSPAQIPQGKRTATVAATDNAGNSASQAFGQWWIDTIPPIPSVTFSPASPDGENGWYITDPTLTVLATDPNGADGSGVNGRFYTLDGGAETPFTTPVTVTGDGLHVYSARATDVAGNSGTTGDQTVKVDTTAPVFDAIQTNPESRSLSTLVAAWSCSDADSGVWYYEYWIGTTSGGNDVKGVTITTNNYAYVMNLNLIPGQSYYFTVRARNAAGLWSGAVVSDPILAAQGQRDESPSLNSGGVSVLAEARASVNYKIVDSIGQFVVAASDSANYTIEHGGWHSVPSWPVLESIGAARSTGNDVTIQLGTEELPVVVTVGTSTFSDRFYVEQPNRSSGMAVQYGGAGGPTLIEGDRIYVVGRLETLANERIIRFAAPSFVDHVDPLGPLYMSVPNIGGAAFGDWTPGVIGAYGLNNVGLLVKTFGGFVSYRDPQERFFYLDAGDGLYDGSHYGMRIVCDGFAGGGKLAMPGYGQQVIVTGISTIVTINTHPVRAIHPRRQADIQVVP